MTSIPEENPIVWQLMIDDYNGAMGHHNGDEFVQKPQTKKTAITATKTYLIILIF